MISHKWINNKCVCGCERIGKTSTTMHIKDGVKLKYIECTRPIPDNKYSKHYHGKKDVYKFMRATDYKDKIMNRLELKINSLCDEIKECALKKEDKIRVLMNMKDSITITSQFL